MFQCLSYTYVQLSLLYFVIQPKQIFSPKTQNKKKEGFIAFFSELVKLCQQPPQKLQIFFRIYNFCNEQFFISKQTIIIFAVEDKDFFVDFIERIKLKIILRIFKNLTFQVIFIYYSFLTYVKLYYFNLMFLSFCCKKNKLASNL